MNAHEERAWRSLVNLGAVEGTLGGLPSLDLRPIRIRSERSLRRFVAALAELPGRSGTIRRHVYYDGSPVFLVHGDRKGD